MTAEEELAMARSGWKVTILKLQERTGECERLREALDAAAYVCEAVAKAPDRPETPAGPTRIT